MSPGELGIYAGFGLAGSLHCALMCGPLACMAAKNLRQTLAYQTGRLAGYLLLGVFAGLLGEALGIFSPLFQSGGLALFSATMLLFFVFIPKKGTGVWIPHEIRGVVKRIESIFLLKLKSHPSRAGLILGFMTLFLPCGLLYAALVLAASEGTIPGSVQGMGAFFFGTLPAVLLPQLGFQRILSSLSPNISRLLWSTLLLILIQILLVRGFNLLGDACHPESPGLCIPVAENAKISSI